MNASRKIVAPPFHVQDTAGELRNGFPYFHHHDSVRALWQDRWRTPCSQGIYPFMDANVDDFDPIFAELARLSDDKTDILFRPDDYAKLFTPVAQALVLKAELAESEADLEKARELFIRAAAVFRISRFPINRSPQSESAWQQGKSAYIKGAHLLDPPISPVQIPFGHTSAAAGDKPDAIQALLHLPSGQAPTSGWPVVLFICGLDAYKTDNTPRTQAHVQHGFAVLLFEIPGTGDCPASPSDPSAPDRLMSSVLEWVDANHDRYRFDLRRICARGISTGGYYAMRVAHTHADRLHTVVAQGGGCHYMFEPDWIRAQDQMEYPYALAEALAYKFGFREDDSVSDYIREAKQFSLFEAGILDRPSCKLGLVNGLEDSIFPIEDNLLCALSGKNKSLLLNANVGHMGNPGGEQLVYGFLDNAIKN